MTNETTYDLDAIPIVEGRSFDARKYKGMQVNIATVKIESAIDWYTGPEDDNGKPTYNPNSTEKKKIVLIETVFLPELDSNGKPTNNTSNISVKRRFNLKKEVNKTTGQVEWVISKAPKAELWAFMRNNGANKLSELIGKPVVLTVAADKESKDKYWLRIAD